MKVTVLITGLCLSTAPVSFGQVAQTPAAETKYVTIEGEVIRYEAGRVIVVRGADNKEVTYTLAPSIAVPAEVKVGQRVTLYTEPGQDGGMQLVTRVTTTSITPDGKVQQTTEDTRKLPSGATTSTTTTTISGTVVAYDAGKAVTVTRADGTKVTYLLNEKSQVPADLVIGKTITIVPMAPAAGGQPVAQTITYIVREN